MNGVLTILSVQDGRIKRSSLEALSRSRVVAAERGVPCQAAILHSSAESLAITANEYGASTVFVSTNPAFDSHVNAIFVDGLEEVLRQASPNLVVAASTESMKDILGALSIRMDAAVLPDVASFDGDGSGTTCNRPVMAAKMVATTKTDHPLVMVTVRSGSYEATPSPVSGNLVDVGVSPDVHALRQRVREVITSAGEQVDLSEARVVVAAGRGVKDEEGRRLVDALASATGAAIGASRAVVENGLFPATSQIGQTGKVVSPELYFAIGISGAIQHVAGMSNSRVIVAINKDAEAPIFGIATYGLVGDLYRILPLLTQEISKAIKAG